MSVTLIAIIASTLLVSSGSLIGVLSLSVKPVLLNRYLLPLVSLSAGTMLGAAFLHLLPESLELLEPALTHRLALFAFVSFFLLERFIHYRHCHDKDHLTKHTIGIMNLVGDGLHNFIDGLLIAASFASGETLGLAAVLAIALHEIPQEIGDFGVLLHSGFSRRTALIANIGISLTAVAGGIIGYLLSLTQHNITSFLIPIAAGGFIYVAATDLVPELKESKTTKKTLSTIFMFFIGITLMFLLGE